MSRFKLLPADNLVKYYEAWIQIVKEHQDEYQSFLEDVAFETEVILREICENLANLEKERLGIEHAVKLDEDIDLLQTLSIQRIQILDTAKAAGYAAILMLKKLEMLSAGLEKFANDEQTQKQTLRELVKSLNNRRNVYKLQIGIDDTRRQVEELNRIALNFQETMRPLLGSFQTVLNRVNQTDKDEIGRAHV